MVLPGPKSEQAYELGLRGLGGGEGGKLKDIIGWNFSKGPSGCRGIGKKSAISKETRLLKKKPQGL